MKSCLTLADSVHSVGVISELTTLQTVPPQAAPVVQPAIAEPQVDPGNQLDQEVNVPYLPQCKYYPSSLQFSLRIPHTSSLLRPVADSFRTVFQTTTLGMPLSVASPSGGMTATCGTCCGTASSSSVSLSISFSLL